MPKFRKKPIVIEAFQMTKEARWDNRDWPEWLNEAWNFNPSDDGALSIDRDDEEPFRRLQITTLKGTLTVDWDDWIIQGVSGELYPCKPDIFEATYEAVNE